MGSWAPLKQGGPKLLSEATRAPGGSSLPPPAPAGRAICTRRLRMEASGCVYSSSER